MLPKSYNDQQPHDYIAVGTAALAVMQMVVPEPPLAAPPQPTPLEGLAAPERKPLAEAKEPPMAPVAPVGVAVPPAAPPAFPPVAERKPPLLPEATLKLIPGWPDGRGAS